MTAMICSHRLIYCALPTERRVLYWHRSTGLWERDHVYGRSFINHEASSSLEVVREARTVICIYGVLNSNCSFRLEDQNLIIRSLSCFWCSYCELTKNHLDQRSELTKLMKMMKITNVDECSKSSSRRSFEESTL